MLFAPFLPHTSATLHGCSATTDALEAVAGASSPSRAAASCPPRGRCSASSSPRPPKPRPDPFADALGARLSPGRLRRPRVGYATLTPIWQNPDEPAHYNYVAFVAADRRLARAAARRLGLGAARAPQERRARSRATRSPRSATRPGSRRCSTCSRRRCSASARRTIRSAGAAPARCSTSSSAPSRSAWPTSSPATLSPPARWPRPCRWRWSACRCSPPSRPRSAPIRWPICWPRRARAGPARSQSNAPRLVRGIGALLGLGLLTKLALAIFVPAGAAGRRCGPRGPCATARCCSAPRALVVAAVAGPPGHHLRLDRPAGHQRATPRSSLDQPRFPGLSADVRSSTS